MQQMTNIWANDDAGDDLLFCYVLFLRMRLLLP